MDRIDLGADDGFVEVAQPSSNGEAPKVLRFDLLELHAGMEAVRKACEGKTYGDWLDALQKHVAGLGFTISRRATYRLWLAVREKTSLALQGEEKVPTEEKS